MRLIRRLTAIAALLVGALLPSAAWAATLYITEYANIGAIGTNTTPWPPGPAITTQQVAVGGGSLQSSAFNSQTKAIQVICDIGCSVSVGSNPTAATTSTLLQQGVYQNFVVAPGQKIAVIANTAGNTSGGTPSGTQDVNIVTCAVTATSLCKAEDAVAGSGDTGVAMWGVVTDGATGLSASGDYSVIGTDTAGNSRVVGSVASGSSDSGNPVKIGGRYNSTLPTVTDGQRIDAQFTSRGSLLSKSVLTGAAGADGFTNSLGYVATDGFGSTAAVLQGIAGYSFNGSTWDRQFTCPSSAVINVNNTTSQLVALSGTTVIRVCSFSITSSAAGTGAFIYGTGTNCNSGTTSLTGAMTMATGSPISNTGMNGSLFRGAAGAALCFTAGTGTVTGFVTYAQY